MLPSAPELRWAGGLVHSSLVGAQTATPTCSAVPRVMAGLHALNLVGQVTANSSDAALFRDWAPGPYGEWSGDCKKLASTAWYRATGAPLVSVNAKPELRLLLGAALPEGLQLPALREPGGLQHLPALRPHRSGGRRQPDRLDPGS